MVEKMPMIKNPLTIIAIFAGIAEVSGTLVIRFLSQANQGLFIWFVMLFPTLLVGLFFWTLHKNHRVLYGPGDYKDEKNFMPIQDEYGTPLAQSESFPNRYGTPLAQSESFPAEQSLQSPTTIRL